MTRAVALNEKERLMEMFRSEGHKEVRELPDGRIIGVLPMLFTHGLYVGMTEYSYDRRYCYENNRDALEAARTWDGKGDPPGPWIKEKPSDRLGPGATE
jgi:hypothetical protein